jgi:hypothetical protein
LTTEHHSKRLPGQRQFSRLQFYLPERTSYVSAFLSAAQNRLFWERISYGFAMAESFLKFDSWMRSSCSGSNRARTSTRRAIGNLFKLPVTEFVIEGISLASKRTGLGGPASETSTRMGGMTFSFRQG